VSAEEFKKLQDTLDSRFQGLSAQLGVVTNRTKNPEKPEIKPPENQTLEEQFAAFRKERDDERAALAEERRETKIDSAINGVTGLDEVSRKLLKSFVKDEYGKSIVNEGKDVVYIAPDQSKKTLNELMSEVMGSVGKRFLSAPSNPSGNGLAGGGNKGMPAVKPTYQQMMADTKLLMQMQELDPEYVANEQNKALLEMRPGRK
jgi:hypothetical protein